MRMIPDEAFHFIYSEMIELFTGLCFPEQN